MNIHHLIGYSHLKAGLLEMVCQLHDDELYTRPMMVRDLMQLVDQIILLETLSPPNQDMCICARTIPTQGI